jgi:hypothetical protein
MTKQNQPELYVMGSSSKGLSLTDPRGWDGLNANSLSDIPGITAHEAYTSEAWTRRCVSVRANGLASMPFTMTKLGSDIPVWTQDEEPPDELAFLDMFGFLFRASASMALKGFFAAQLEGQFKRSDFAMTKITGLSWLNPNTVSYVGEKGEYGPGPDGKFRYWKRNVNGLAKYLPVEWVASGSVPSPFAEQGYGSSDGEASKAHSQILQDMASFTSDQLRSGLPKKTVFVVGKDAPRNPSEETVKGLELWISKFLRGAKGTPPKILQGIDTKEIGSNLSDLQNAAISADAREAIATGYGVPHSLVLSNAANFATAGQDVLNFYNTTVIPESRILQRVLNNKVLNLMGYQLKFEPKKLEAFQQAELETAEKVFTLTGGRAVLSRRQAGEMLGVDYTPDDLEELNRIDAQRGAQRGPQDAQAPIRSVDQDLNAWRRKVAKRGRDVDFSPDYLGDHEASVIRERLTNKHIPVDDCFKGPFVGF